MPRLVERVTAAAVDPRAVAALAVQLEQRRAALRGGVEHVGWKLGVGDRERIGGELAVGHLTSATLLPPGGSFAVARATELHADAELAVELGRDVGPGSDASAVRAAIARFAVALELVDLAAPPDEPEAVVAANVFHRAVAFGRFRAALPGREPEGALVVDGELRASGAVASDLAERICAAARVLAACGERLRAGDRVITGSIVQVPVAAGDEVVARIAGLGEVGLRIGPSRASRARAPTGGP